MSGRLRGGVLTAISRIVTQGAQLVTFLVAAASMSPADFGIFALVSAGVVILTTISGAGWPEYAMQWSGEERQQRRVLAMSIASGSTMALICFFLALATPIFTEASVAKPLMELFSVTILLSGAANTFNGILIWRHRLSSAAISIIVSELIGMIVAIWLLRDGYGVFALAWGKIVASSTWLLLGALQTRLAPEFRIPFSAIKEISLFVANMMSVRMMITLRAYSGTILVGFFLGASDAGFFRAAQRLAGAVSEVIGEPMRVLCWSLFRETRDGKTGLAGFQDRANSLLPLVLAISLPCYATLAISSSDLVTGLLGEEWAPAAPVLTAFAFVSILFSLSSGTEPILSLAGAVRAMPRMVFENLITGVGLTLAAGPFGLLWIAWAQVIAALVIVLRNALVLRDQARVRLSEVLWVSKLQLPSLVLSLLITQIIQRYILSINIDPLIRFILSGANSVIIFLALLLTVDLRIRLAIKSVLYRKTY